MHNIFHDLHLPESHLKERQTYLDSWEKKPKKTRWNPRTRMPTRMLKNRKNTYLSHFPTNPLVGHPWRDTLRWHSCRTPFLLDTLTWHSFKTLLLDTSYWTSCKTLLLDTLAWHSSGTLVLDILVRHSYLTLFWDTLTWHFCKTLLTWHSCLTLLTRHSCKTLLLGTSSGTLS